ncbi:MAG TPA: DUF4337 family protein [Caulobacteraceae bacterium]|jgi:hypothetical protein|nr:DUF4337 family protein [Caulobacteraceae bacterium]
MSDPALEAHEHTEHAEHAAHANNPFISRVSITIAVLAVLAAVTGSLEAVEAGSAIIDANQAVLKQDEATDAWDLYQARSLKKHMYGIAADTGGPKADDYKKTSKHESDEATKTQNDALGLEKERETLLAESAVHEARHHHLTVGATLLEIGIAIATIAIITRQRWTWIASAMLGIAGAAVAAASYLL